MSETISTETLPVTTKTVVERTWAADIVFPYAGVGSLHVHRERVNEIPGQTAAVERGGSPAEAGAPADGTDGKQAANYTKTKKGFVPEFSVTFADLAAYAAGKTISAAGLTVPVNAMPDLLLALFDFLAKKQKADQVDAAVARAIASVAG